MIPQLQAGESEGRDRASRQDSTSARWENIPIQRRQGSYRQGTCPCVFHPPVVFAAPDTNQLIQVTGPCHGLGVLSQQKQLDLPAVLCQCRNTMGRTQTPVSRARPRRTCPSAACTEGLQHSLPKPHCSSRLIQEGFGPSLLLHTIRENVWSCNDQWNKGWRIFFKGNSTSLPLCSPPP